MSKYIPFPAFPDDAPLDLRFAYGREAPAGKHGFLKVDGTRFVFEDGTEARFWGTCFNSGANFPTHEYAEAVALRLAKIGCNMVRFHQIDAEWSTPNIFQFTKGERQADSLSLDPESMERLDYLIHCLKKNGIYLYMDIFTYRKFKSGDSVENAHLLSDAAKPYSTWNRRMIELQKKLAYDIWTHVNPYTGLAYKDDPAFVLCEVANETDPFQFPIIVEPFTTEFRTLYDQWLKENHILDIDPWTCDVNAKEKILTDFKICLMERYYEEMCGYFREIGVKIPITGNNFSTTRAQMRTQMNVDFMDNHPYDWGADWGEIDKYSTHYGISQKKGTFLDVVAVAHHVDKPYFISEWDAIWPNARRAESPLFLAAVGLLQGWSGATIHTYSYTSRLGNALLGKEFSCASIGGVPYREGIFSTWNDPAKFGLFYHAALMTRRGDIAKSEQTTAVRIDQFERNDFPNVDALAECMRVGSDYQEYPAGSAQNHIRLGESLAQITDEDVRSDTGELYRNWKKEYGTIDSGRTKVAYGALRKNGEICLNGMKVTSQTRFAVIALSSLTNANIDCTDNMLLTTVGHARNKNAQFENDQLIDYGTGPIEIEVIEADIAIRTEQKNLCVWAISAEGYYVGRVPAQYQDGWLRFTLGKNYPSMYYLIRTE